ncbi:transposase [Streptomyces sp. V4I8]
MVSDIAWQALPLELGFGSGQTYWCRLDRCQQAGVLDRLHRILLAKLHAAGQLDWSCACADGSHVRVKTGGAVTGRHRSTGGKPAAHHLTCGGKSTPPHIIATAANVNDVTQTLALDEGTRR